MTMPVCNMTGIGSRLKSERERLGFTLEQFAVLGGTDAETLRKLEAEEYLLPFDFVLGLKGLGCNLLFISTGEGAVNEPSGNNPPARLFKNVSFDDSNFRSAVNLMLRSTQAVDAFFGSGQAKKSPELVAALMQATLSNEYDSGAGEREELVGSITNAIEALTDVVVEAFINTDDKT